MGKHIYYIPCLFKRLKMTSIVIKWSGTEYSIDSLSGTDSVLDLKNLVCKATGVLPHRQKLLGLKFKGKPAADDVAIQDLNLKAGAKIMMMRTFPSRTVLSSRTRLPRGSKSTQSRNATQFDRARSFWYWTLTIQSSITSLLAKQGVT